MNDINEYTLVNEIGAKHIHKRINLCGRVDRISERKIGLTKACFRCNLCGFVTEKGQEIEFPYEKPQPPEECLVGIGGCGSKMKGKQELLMDHSTFQDFWILNITTYHKTSEYYFEKSNFSFEVIYTGEVEDLLVGSMVTCEAEIRGRLEGSSSSVQAYGFATELNVKQESRSPPPNKISTRKIIDSIRDMMLESFQDNGFSERSTVIQMAAEKNISEPEVETIIKRMLSTGEIYESSINQFRFTR